MKRLPKLQVASMVMAVIFLIIEYYGWINHIRKYEIAGFIGVPLSFILYFISKRKKGD